MALSLAIEKWQQRGICEFGISKIMNERMGHNAPPVVYEIRIFSSAMDFQGSRNASPTVRIRACGWVPGRGSEFLRHHRRCKRC